ncbi:MAG: glycerate kinase [Elusimicrobia bacterium]|nr:glycerate kinase [Elusimicrobiota bacterium]
MRVLVAPNAFKGSLSSREAARVMARAVHRAGASPFIVPLADGGDGTLDILRKPLQLIHRRAKTVDPLGRPLTVQWGYNSGVRLAVIEMARASGLALLEERERRPLQTSSYGTGVLIRAALQSGAHTILIGLGGSATVDGGAGILQALGAHFFLKKKGKVILLERPVVGKDLITLHEVDVRPLLNVFRGVRLRVLCDVVNPLLGSRGAARAFGPQKGATPAEVRSLERGLMNLSILINLSNRTRSPLMGAAGGAAAGLHRCAQGTLEQGVKTIFRLTELERKLKRSHMVLTGEGQVDRTSWEGKPLGELARLCHRHKKPLIVFTGRVGRGGRRRGVKIICLGRRETSLDLKIRRAGAFLEEAIENFLKKMRK